MLRGRVNCWSPPDLPSCRRHPMCQNSQERQTAPWREGQGLPPILQTAASFSIVGRAQLIPSNVDQAHCSTLRLYSVISHIE